MKDAELAGYRPQHFLWHAEERVGVITLHRPEKKNPLTFDSYAELRDLFRRLANARDVRAVVITGAGGNFCSGGDVHDMRTRDFRRAYEAFAAKKKPVFEGD